MMRMIYKKDYYRLILFAALLLLLLPITGFAVYLLIVEPIDDEAILRSVVIFSSYLAICLPYVIYVKRSKKYYLINEKGIKLYNGDKLLYWLRVENMISLRYMGGVGAYIKGHIQEEIKIFRERECTEFYEIGLYALGVEIKDKDLLASDKIPDVIKSYGEDKIIYIKMSKRNARKISRILKMEKKSYFKIRNRD